MRKALGRGLNALLPAAPSEAVAPRPAPAGPDPAGPPRTARVADIAPNPDQPRRRFDSEELASLTESIRLHGLLQPLVVRAVANGFELIAGERRLRAARQAGLEEVPIVVRDAEPPERLELALIENLQRAELTALEEAEAYRQLIESYGLTQEDIASRVGKSRPAVANALRLLALPESVKAQLDAGELSAGHARAVLAVDGDEARVAFAREITAQKLPKSEAERRAKSRRAVPAPARTARLDPHWRALADDLTRTLGTRVRVVPRGRGGTIEIEFYSDAELARLVDHLQPGSAAARAF